MKRRFKIAVDVLMFVLFIYLMGYAPGRSGLYEHGVIGMALFGLFVLHNLLNIGWYKSLTKGRYPFQRKLFIVTDFALIADMVLMALSSFMLSGMIFPISVVQPTQFARTLHVGSTAWGFFIMSMHVGLHMSGIFSAIERQKRPITQTLVYLLYGVILCAGAYSCVDSGMWEKMMLHVKWHEPQELIIFYSEYLSVFLAASLAVHLLFKAKGYTAWMKAQAD